MPNNNKTIKGIENLKDEFRRAKLIVGDLRGLKNRFQLAQRLGINQLQTYFYAAGGNGENRMEVYADITPLPQKEGKVQYSFWSYSIKEMVEEIRTSYEVEFEIDFYYCKWNKKRTDADRIRIGQIPTITFFKS
jgi:hypothetical protein